MPASKRLPNALKRKAAAWAGQLTKLAKSFAPEHLKPYISSHVEDRAEGVYLIRIHVDKNKNPAEKYGSADARAQEYGSGLHARRGVKSKYPILPKNGRFLAFPWEIANANPDSFSFLPDGRVLLPKVMHPGIEAANDGQGYIAPAIKELKAKAREELDPVIRQAIMDDIRTSFKGAKRK